MPGSTAMFIPVMLLICRVVWGYLWHNYAGAPRKSLEQDVSNMVVS